MIFEPTAPNLNPFIKLYPYNKFFSIKMRTEFSVRFFMARLGQAEPARTRQSRVCTARSRG